MLRFLVRSLGVLLLSAAFVAVVIDGTRSIAASEIVLTPLGSAWEQLSPETLDSARETAGERLPSWAWDRGVVALLEQPGFVVFGVLGILLIILGRRRTRRSVGFAA